MTREEPGNSGRGVDTPFISIDKEGNWFYQGLPIINRQIVSLFSQSLDRDADGTYVVRIGAETCPVAVEDEPFVVVDVAKEAHDEPENNRFIIRLNDETEEPLDLDSLAVGMGNVLYCAVKGGKFKARFLRPSYYRLAEHIVQEADDRFYIPLNGKKYYIK